MIGGVFWGMRGVGGFCRVSVLENEVFVRDSERNAAKTGGLFMSGMGIQWTCRILLAVGTEYSCRVFRW